MKFSRRLSKLSLLVLCSLLLGISVVYAATNIDTRGVGEKWGWNDVFGWINMADTNTVQVSMTGVSGYASSSIGAIVFDCATPPFGPSWCPTSNFKTINDGTGLLSGFAWNDLIGWISMSGQTADNRSYQVRVVSANDDINSYFHGWAWNDVVGWITFNCNDYEILFGNMFCVSVSNYKTQTSAGATPTNAEFTSNIFDIGTSSGLFNTLTWKGSQPAGTSVKFQIATATTASALTGAPSVVFAGSTWFDVNPASASPVKLSKDAVVGYVATGVEVENRRYIRYRVALSTTVALSPQIDDIILNWSP